MTSTELRPPAHEGMKACAQESSPAYIVLKELLDSSFRVGRAADLNLIKSTSSRYSNAFSFTCGIIHNFEVPDGHVRCANDGEGHYLFYGPGVHSVTNPFLILGQQNRPLTSEIIENGNRTIVTVKQGYVGYAEDMGQPVLLPPGLHEWQSATMKYIESIDLNNTLIRLGPYSILTVDEGYAAITQNNGSQVVLKGGNTHLLSHRNWKFEKFMTEKIQTDDLQRIEATSADNVMMHTDATVVWRITDVIKAAKLSAETMRSDGNEVMSALQSDIKKLRNDVLKQATASLASFIGGIRYSASFHISSAATQANQVTTGLPLEPAKHESSEGGGNHIFDSDRMAGAVELANRITQTYGVSILSINIISATPADKNLQLALAQGAVAAAEAEQAEITARGQAKAARIAAEGAGDAERLRAEGARAAADLLEASSLANQLSIIQRTGEALNNKTTFFFGADAKNLPGLISNPAIVHM